MSGFDPRLLFYFFLTETLNNWQRPFTTGKFASPPSLIKLPNFMGITGLQRKKNSWSRCMHQHIERAKRSR